ncbi:MAG: lipase maturation factor family protein [Acidobacteriaceae bacterium]|nr:lipase maturation factor family protein [Acidobacteriaceae bacterium]
MDDRGVWITRLLLVRGIGIISLIAFIVALNQFRPLLGERGLLPVPLFVKQVPFRATPSLFFLFPRDIAFTVAAWIGIILSSIAISGVAERYSSWVPAAMWGAIYVLYLSFVNIGQTFYGFGWESILLESCFLCMFLGSSRVTPQQIPIWLFRWLLFRLMFGAGLIKLRGDPCWRDLTCLFYHYETQPMPNPLSWYFHWAPHWVNKTGVLFNHFSELIVPFGYFFPQPIAGIAGVITIIFQLSIIASGNLSWLNWLTLFLAFSTIDGKFLHLTIRPPSMSTPTPLFQWMNIGVAAIVALLSIPVVINMLSARQIMNTSFNPFHLVGTYGAFGSITRPRYEVIVEGTDDAVVTSATRWREYEFKGKPGDVKRWPPQIAPYHLRLDWLMWFAAMSSYQDYPWFVNFVAKLLEGDKDVLSLLRSNPFPDHPPKYVRAQQYEYHFTTTDERKRTRLVWKRTLVGEYFPAISLDSPGFRRVLKAQGWLE